MAKELSVQDQRWSAHIENLRTAPESKMLSSLVVLTSEIFLLKAENERLRIALAQKGVIDEATLAEAAASADFAALLRKEQIDLNEAVFKGWLKTDDAPDSSVEYEKELQVDLP